MLFLLPSHCSRSLELYTHPKLIPNMMPGERSEYANPISLSQFDSRCARQQNPICKKHSDDSPRTIFVLSVISTNIVLETTPPGPAKPPCKHRSVIIQKTDFENPTMIPKVPYRARPMSRTDFRPNLSDNPAAKMAVKHSKSMKSDSAAAEYNPTLCSGIPASRKRALMYGMITNQTAPVVGSDGEVLVSWTNGG